MLTDTKIKQSRPREKEYNLSCGIQPGLFLRIRPTGSKSWLQNYTSPVSQKRTNLGLGQYPSISLVEARKLASNNRELLAKGVDPKQAREKIAREYRQEQQATFKATSEEWLILKEQQVSPAYLVKIKQGFCANVYPNLGSIPVTEITPKLIIDALEPLAVRNKRTTLHKNIRWINEVLTYAANTGIITQNFCQNVGKAFPSPETKNMLTISPQEIPQLIEAIQEAAITVTTRNLLLWQLHTMTRPVEASKAEWTEIDFENKVWTIPASKMKKRRSHTIPLSSQMITLLEDMRSVSGNKEFIFPGHTNPGKAMNSQTANMALKRMGYKNKLVAHGLRALASTCLNEQGFDPQLIELSLAHEDKNTIRGIYNRAEYIEQRRVMMQWWSNHLSQSTTGKLEASNLRSLKLVSIK